MCPRITLASVLATSALALSAVLAAPSAKAATVGVAIDSATNPGTDTGSPAVVPPGTANLDINDDLDVTNQYPNASVTITGTCAPLGGAINQTITGANSGSNSWTVRAVANGFCSLTVTGPTAPSATLFVQVGSSPPAPPAPTPSDSSSLDSAPSPVVQQFGMPATDTCDEAQPVGLNLSGVPSGGWGISWAQWMNGGTGGAVCTRTLNYSTAQSKWVVN